MLLVFFNVLLIGLLVGSSHSYCALPLMVRFVRTAVGFLSLIWRFCAAAGFSLVLTRALWLTYASVTVPSYLVAFELL